MLNAVSNEWPMNSVTNYQCTSESNRIKFGHSWIARL